MPHPTSDESAAAWSAAGPGYARSVAPRLMEAFSAEFVDRLGPSTDERALEVAAGSGALTMSLAPRVASLVATDLAPAMVRILRERLSSAGATSVSVRRMDGQDLDVSTDSFDCAACNFALMLFPDRRRGFSELLRALRPGGRVMVSAWADADRFEIFGLLLTALRLAFPDLPALETPPPVLSLADPTVFREEMESAGFRDVSVDYVSRDLQFAGFEDAWSMLTVGAPPVEMLLQRVGAEGRSRLEDALRDVIHERYGHGSFVVTNSATLALARAP